MKTLLAATAFAVLSLPAFAQDMSAEQFTTKAAQSDLFEITSSQLALERGQDQNIKAFAQTMIDHHTKSSEQLKAAAAEVKLTPPTAPDEATTAKLQQLQAAEGANFDAAYAQMQVAGHQETATLLESYSANGDQAPLKSFAATALPMVKEHLDMAAKLPGAKSM